MAGRIPQSFLDELLTRVDIVDVIDPHVSLTKAGKDYKARCPFHEEKTPSFTVSPDKGFYHCFGCGAHGSAISFLMEYERMSFPEAVEALAARTGLPVPKEVQSVAAPAQAGSDLLVLLQEADRYYRRQLREHPQAKRAVAYLKGRGLSGEVAARFGLGYAPDGWDNLVRALGTDQARCSALLKAGLLAKRADGSYYDRFRDRVMFPIHDYRGRIVGFGGRVLDQSEPKYLNSPETPMFHKGREMYGLYLARDAIRREQRALVVEGYMDVVALAQFGVDFVVATLGTATTRDHVERLFRFTSDVTFCFDGDRAGRQAAWRALENALSVLRAGRQISFLFLPEGQDPDSVIREEGKDAFLARHGEAVPLPDFFFDSLQKRADVSRLDGRARLAEIAGPILSKIPDGVLRQMMIERLAHITRLSPERLSAVILKPDTKFVPKVSTGLKDPESLVRRAVALLLQRPALARRVEDPKMFAGLEMPGLSLLTSLLDLLRAKPDLNAGAITERFRDSEYRPYLEKLVQWAHPVLEQDVNAEFDGIVDKLHREALGQRIETLLHKGDHSPGDKAELNQLLAERAQLDNAQPSH
ncbi:MAG: DNA primase [Acidiferrobacterales bacterium]